MDTIGTPQDIPVIMEFLPETIFPSEIDISIENKHMATERSLWTPFEGQLKNLQAKIIKGTKLNKSVGILLLMLWIESNNLKVLTKKSNRC